MTSLRYSKQRQAILEVLRVTDSHPDAGWVYQQVRAMLPHISLGTVYRNLALLAGAGLAREIKGCDQVSHWDGRMHDHGHISCTQCGKIADVELASLPADWRECVAAATGFHIPGCRIDLTGMCETCWTRMHTGDHTLDSIA